MPTGQGHPFPTLPPQTGGTSGRRDRAPTWEREGAGWPNRDASTFLLIDGIRWHVQQMGEGPPLLLLHGTGAATHSWRDFAPLLARRFRVIAPDLPGHGFTECPDLSRLSLPGMSRAVGALLRSLGAAPTVVVGHSAGAAICARMAIDGEIAPRAIVSLNGALLPWRGMPGKVFSPLARLLSANGVAARFVAWRAGEPGAVERLLHSTGSHIDAAGREWYRRLVCSPTHVASVLAMMARWDLTAFAEDLPRLTVPLWLVVGDHDGTVSPADADRIRQRLPGPDPVRLAGLGHLAHEESPRRVAEVVVRVARAEGVLAPDSEAMVTEARP
jgi:magnesium chelatase accessory protein